MAKTAVRWRSVGARVRRFRRAKGMSQEEVAAPRYSAAYISHIESGGRRPTDEVLDHIAGRLGVSVDELLTGRSPDFDVRLQLEIDKAVAAIHSEQLESAKATLEDLRDQAKNASPTVLGRAEEALGVALYHDGDFEAALDHFVDAEALLDEGPPETRTAALIGRARCLFGMGRLTETIYVLETHLLQLTHDGAPDPTATLWVYASLIGPYFESGFKDKAAEMADKALELEPRVSDPEQVACLHLNRAVLLLNRGHSAQALKSLTRAEDMFRQLGWARDKAKASIAKAQIHIDKSELAQAEKRLSEALDVLDSAPHALDRARALNQLARVKRLRGDSSAALEMLGKAEQNLGGRISQDAAWNRREAGLCYLELKKYAQAEACLRDAIDIYRGAEAALQVATTAAQLGDVLSRRGKQSEAAKAYRDGLKAVEDLR
jgi:tetratricopeptide (TPR) repeat protein